MTNTLKPLTPKLKEALGKNNNLATKYEQVLKKSETQSLRDDSDAISYVDSVIQRFKLIENSSPSNDKMIEMKTNFLEQLKNHAIDVSRFSFTKPAELSARLELLNLTAQDLENISQTLEQAGGEDPCVACMGACVASLACADLCLAVNSGGHHHHHHHSSW